MTAVHHTAIVTADVERSIRFWRDGLGLIELFDHTFTGDGHQHTITTPGTVLASGAGTSNTTTTSPAHGTTATTRQPPPYYSLAYVMYTGP